jgi:hypothetical protein
MNKYILTSAHYTGSVIFYYDDAGLLLFYSALDADINERVLLQVLKKLPRDIVDLEPFNASEFYTVKKLDEDLSFENFWNQYGVKIHPHRCEPLWKKLSDVKKLAALKAMAPYFDYCTRKSVYKVNPENYIKKEYWKTNWSKEI